MFFVVKCFIYLQKWFLTRGTYLVGSLTNQTVNTMNRKDEFWNFILNGDKSTDSTPWFEKKLTDTQVFELYVIDNPDNSPRWVFSKSLKEPLFLKFYPITSLRSKVIHTLFRLLFAVGLIRLVARKVIVSNHELPFFTNWLTDSTSELVLFAGTVGPNQKIISYQKDKSGKSFFKKIAFGKDSHQLIQKEQKVLALLSEYKNLAFTYPKLIASANSHIQIAEINLGKSDAELLSSHRNALQSLYNLGERQVGFNHEELNKSIQHIASSQAKDATLVALRDTIIKVYQLASKNDHTIKFGLGHGDFTPWNCGESNGQLNIIDWELAGQYPLLYDVFHFIIQNEIMNTKHDATIILDKVYKLMNSAEWIAFCSENKLKWKNQFIAYVLHVSSYYYHVYSKQEVLHYQAYRAMKIWIEMFETISLQVSGISIRSVFAQKLFAYLRNTPYALMKNDGKKISELNDTSDFDLFIDKLNTASVVRWIKSQPEISKCYTQTTSYMKVVTLYFHDGSFLSIDFIHQLKRKNIEYMTIDKVVETAFMSEDGLKLPQVHYDMQYLIPEKYYSYITRMDNRQRVSILNYLKLKMRFSAATFDDFYNGAFSKVAYKLKESVQELSQNKGVNRLKNNVNYVIDTARKMIKGNGLVISFSGVDGAGKSTIINHVKETLETRFRRNVVVLRHRPSMLPILSAWRYGKKEAEQRAASTLPRQGQNTSSISSFLRFSYYLMDFLIGQLAVWFKHTLRGDIILYDRYYFDFIEDPKRSNISLPRWFRKLFYRFIFKPNINIFLHAQPELILKRKQELNREDIIQLTASYKSLFTEFGKSYSGKYVSIENDDLTITLEQIESLYVSAA